MLSDEVTLDRYLEIVLGLACKTIGHSFNGLLLVVDWHEIQNFLI